MVFPPQPPNASKTTLSLHNSAIYIEISSGVTEYQPIRKTIKFGIFIKFT